MNADALSIASDVRSGRTSAHKVLDACFSAIKERDSEVRAFVHLSEENARKQADAIDKMVADGIDPGPLAGVPVALKDNLCTVGEPTTCCSKILAQWAPPYDATVVSRLKNAGALLVGKTNMDEFAMGSSTENSCHGPTHNPHDLTKVPGGSSGGSAAAVAAGYVPLSLGSDTGGSIRQPAALCGTVGVKPTYGAVSRYGLIAFASSLDQIGPFANTVADAALLLDVISGHDVKDSTSLSEPIFASRSLNKGVEGLRVGLCLELIDGCAPDVAARVKEAAASLESAGAKIVEVSVPETRYGLSSYYLIAPAEASSNLARYDGVRYGLRIEGADIAATNVATRTQGFGAEVKRRIMLGTYALSAGYYDAYYVAAQKVRTFVANGFARAYGEVDVILGATAPTTAFSLGEKAADPMSMYLSDVFTIPSNLAGHPAISVPYGSGDDGLPIGVQLLGPAASEELLFSVANVLEQANGAKR
jgi:aspartyl-tRNA(Asn)/glutamyl-tRNA(Gln) amidotransferase subunit A